MLYEHHSQPVIPRSAWLLRFFRSFQLAMAVLGAGLAAGTLGYHYLGGIVWVDSFLEACMILSGMGPISPLENNAVKIFASFYALFSGFILLSSSSIVMAPVLHRFLHHFHRKNGH